MSVLGHLTPASVFQYFEALCAIPHGSYNTAAIADFCVNFAKEHGFDFYRDEANNVIIRKHATPGYEQSGTVILQGHTDMVCEKDPGSAFDFATDGIELILEGDTIRANGTTLGADNGIAVAMCFAILTDDAVEHPALEVLLTSDEEVGMLGAFALDCSQLKGKTLINIDSEEEGIITCSCAGGANAYSTIPVQFEEAELALVEVDLGSMCSGHSGAEIHKWRANANVLLARMLYALNTKFDCRIVKLEGGTRETAIAAVGSAAFGVPAAQLDAAAAEAAALAAAFKKEYATAEPTMEITVKTAPAAAVSALTAADTAKLANVLVALPDCVQVMSVDMPGLVQTSVNFGILRLRENEVFFSNTVRSSVATQKQWILDKVCAIVAIAGGKTEISGSYPGWSYNPHSAIKDTIVRVYRDLFGKEASVEAIHAGLECGLFADAIEGLDCVSIGPNMGDVHTPREYLSVASTARTYKLVCEILRSMK
ncbi:MAG: aminoacyl-histidine dipeptidase [Oscillospiraceae bacterium]|nr:aminoacyl-histidine dipeptidase [Oscillospiraceae bacterium]